MSIADQEYDLEERTFLFAQRVAKFLKTIPMDLANREYAKQLIRSSGSVAANYLEANESLGKGDFRMHMKISRKEAKESRLWIRLLSTLPLHQEEQKYLEKEANELKLIFAAILRKSEGTSV